MPNLERIRPSAADASPSPQPAGQRGTDPLLGCLLAVAQAHGQSVTPDGVLAGLPLEGGRLSPALFERAALRAGLSSRIVRPGWLGGEQGQQDQNNHHPMPRFDFALKHPHTRQAD